MTVVVMVMAAEGWYEEVGEGLEGIAEREGGGSDEREEDREAIAAWETGG